MEPNDQVQTDGVTPPVAPGEEQLVTETLVEEVSIDGMCGVY
jgi:mycofactocin precursor